MASPCLIDEPFTFTGADSSFINATSRTGLVGGGTGFTLSVWVYRTRSGNLYMIGSSTFPMVRPLPIMMQ
jgi:hypothetical protein